jgi:hypothetical protein
LTIAECHDVGAAVAIVEHVPRNEQMAVAEHNNIGAAVTVDIPEQPTIVGMA